LEQGRLYFAFYNLGFIIVDEEHEQTFKQVDPAPRYHARDAAIVLAQSHQAKVLLGSPSIETYFNAKSDKFGLIEITERFETY
jgi:primosomal protein N' (replication factor Y)